MAGYNPSQPRQAGGKFGTTGAQKAGAQSVAAPTGITITPQQYQAALRQASKIIAAQRAQSAAYAKMNPAERQAYRTGQTAKRLAITGAKARKRAATLAAQRKAAAAARRPGAVAKGAAMGRSGRPRPSPAPAASSGRSSSSSAGGSAVQARLREYLAGR